MYRLGIVKWLVYSRVQEAPTIKKMPSPRFLPSFWLNIHSKTHGAFGSTTMTERNRGKRIRLSSHPLTLLRISGGIHFFLIMCYYYMYLYPLNCLSHYFALYSCGTVGTCNIKLHLHHQHTSAQRLPRKYCFLLIRPPFVHISNDCIILLFLSVK